MPTITSWIEELAAYLPALRDLENLEARKQDLDAIIADLTKRRDAIEAAYAAKAKNEAREALNERETQVNAELKAKTEAAEQKLEAIYTEMRAAQARTVSARDEAAVHEQRIAAAKQVQAALRKQLMPEGE